MASTFGHAFEDPRMRRYFMPRSSGALKCSKEALELYQTSDGCASLAGTTH